MLAVLAMATPPSEPSVRDRAWQYSLGAGVSAGAALGLTALAAKGRIEQERCRSQPTTFDDFGPASACDRTGAGMSVFGVVAYTTAGMILAGYAGDALAQRDALDGRVRALRDARGFIGGGVALRLAGLVVMFGALGVSSPDACGFSFGGTQAEIDTRMRCYARRTWGRASMVAAGLTLRWAGAGMITYGARHSAQARAQALRPFVQPGGRGALVGLNGRF